MSEKQGAAELARIEALPSELYKGIDLNRLLVFTIGWLRDRSLPLIFEYITVASYRMFPAKFGLRAFQYPDSNRVNRGLLQLGPKYRNWARGSPSTGYALTDQGEAILEHIRPRLGTGGGEVGASITEETEAPTEQPPGYTLDPEAELTELLATPAFSRFRDDGPAALRIDDVWAVVGGFSHTPAEVMRSRLRMLAGIARDADNAPAQAFVRALQDQLKAGATSRRRRRHA